MRGAVRLFFKGGQHLLPELAEAGPSHLNDWQSALVPEYIARRPSARLLHSIKTVFTSTSSSTRALRARPDGEVLGLPEGVLATARWNLAAGFLYEGALKLATRSPPSAPLCAGVR